MARGRIKKEHMPRDRKWTSDDIKFQFMSTRRRSPAFLCDCVYNHEDLLKIRLQVDRVTYAIYHATGKLLQGDTGSITMFGVPQKFGARADGESFLQVGVPSSLLFNFWQACFLPHAM